MASTGLANGRLNELPTVVATDGPTRRWLLLFLKISVAASLTCWLFYSDRLDLGVLAGVAAEPRSLGLALVAMLGVFLGLLLLALRLTILFHSARNQLPYSRALAVTLVGALAGAVLPGLIAGDAVKAVYLCGSAEGRRSHAVATVVVDRALGLYSLFLLATLAVVAGWFSGTLPACGPILWIAPSVTLVATAGLLLVAWPRTYELPLIRALMSRLPGKLLALLEALRDCLQRPRILGVAVGLSLVNHALVVCSFVVAGFILWDQLSLSANFVLSPLAMVLNTVPLTPGGVGLTEGAFSFLFGFAGSPHGATIGLLGRLIQYLAFALGGAPALACLRMSPARRAATC